MLWKNVNKKKLCSKIHILQWKKVKKIPNIFDIEKLTLEFKFWHFLKVCCYYNSQNSIISFDYLKLIFSQKLYNFFIPPLRIEYSTTSITIFSMNLRTLKFLILRTNNLLTGSNYQFRNFESWIFMNLFTNHIDSEEIINNT